MSALLLPASVGGALANLAVLIAGKASVNLNFTAGREAHGRRDRAVRHHDLILTSQQFLAKAETRRRPTARCCSKTSCRR